MLSLNIYNPAFGQPSGSPFCTKAICLLEMSGVEWTINFGNDPRKAPFGKLPVLNDDTQLVPDSAIIQKHLEDKYGADFGSWLTDEQRATGHALQRMAEEHLYFHIVNDRWGRSEVWQHTKSVYFSKLPAIVRTIIPASLRKKAITALNWMGIGRLPDEMLETRVKQDLSAISEILGDKKYLFGDRACFADIAIVPQLAAMAAAPVDTVASKAIKSDGTLTNYITRFQEAHYPKPT